MADEYLTAALYGMKRFTEGVSNKVKDEISTEKLLDLFSDYVKEAKLFGDIIGVGYSKESGEITKLMVEFVDEYDDEEQTKYIAIEKVISNNFGFIEWLVGNDKIDKEKVRKESRIFADGYYNAEETTYDRLIMLLSIQQDPIQFLLSILKQGKTNVGDAECI